MTTSDYICTKRVNGVFLFLFVSWIDYDSEKDFSGAFLGWWSLLDSFFCQSQPLK